MDLVGRKLGQAAAQHQAFLGDVGRSSSPPTRRTPCSATPSRSSASAHEALVRHGVMRCSWLVPGRPMCQMVPLNANRFLEMMSELVRRLAANGSG
jgi:hypothetical protein